jgi:acetylornithine/N-succinyldiaminopimelate aminotransferase
MKSEQIIEMTDKNLVSNYGRFPVAVTRAEGPFMYDAEGKRYLDFLCGISVCNLGHNFPAVVDAIKNQADRVLHTSNFFYTEPPALLAQLLTENSFADRVLFCNSGAEANEAAIKLARKFGNTKGGGRYEIITALKSFHGRTLATISATGQDKVREGFEPRVAGFVHVPPFDLTATAKTIGEKTVAIMVEPIIGEGGVLFPPDDYLAGLRKLCDERNLLLIFDEIQSGIGRSGKLFAYEHWGVRPDIMTLAKALGGGLPIGAMLTGEELAELFGPGSHGTTFGANPVCAAAGLAVLTEMTRPGFFEEMAKMATQFKKLLDEKIGPKSGVQGIRNMGMFFAIDLDFPGKPIIDAAIEQGLIINCVQEQVLRIYPPLNCSVQDLQLGTELLAKAFEKVQ